MLLGKRLQQELQRLDTRGGCGLRLLQVRFGVRRRNRIKLIVERVACRDEVVVRGACKYARRDAQEREQTPPLLRRDTAETAP